MNPVATPFANFLTELNLVLESAQIQTNHETVLHYAQDWSNILAPQASVVLFPYSTLQVSQILKLASAHDQAIVPSGGRTGLSGGAVATQNEVILSLEKLNFIGALHEGALTLHVGAGAITQAVHEFCEPYGLTWPVDFASKGSSMVGGNIATNAGGVRVIRYGNTRNWVLGLTAVTMDGTIHELNGELEKNNTGYDLRQLLIGSEGTLAVVTEATLKLCPLPRAKLVFFFSLASFAQVLELFAFARKKIPNLSAFECLDRASLDSVVKHLGRAAPVKTLGEVFVLMEVESHDTGASAAENLFAQAALWLEEIFNSESVLDGVMAQNDREAQALWQFREAVAESILHGHDVHQEDVSVPIARLNEFYAEIQKRYAEAYSEFSVYFFGHIGDGNLHIFIQKPAGLNRENFLASAKKSDLELFAVLQQYRGSISAEHGVGLLKKHALHFTRSKTELELFRGIKRVFDPKGLLNPGKLLP
jgi:FAD/FMN-containing dehydrogenase